MRHLPYMTLFALLACDAGEIDVATSAPTTDPTDADSDAPPPRPTRPPSEPEVAIQPAAPTSADTLEAVRVFEAVDPDGFEVSYLYAWLRDGDPQPEHTGSTVPASATSRGESWEVRVRATNGAEVSGSASASVNISNAPPTITLSLDPSIAFTTDDLVANIDVVDADGDELTTTVTWTRDGELTAFTGDTIEAEHTARDQTWQVEVVSEDSEGATATATASVTVENSPPLITDFRLRPDPAGHSDSLRVTFAIDDPDDDPLSTTWVWSRNGAPISGVTGTTLGASHTAIGDTIEVALTVSDGSASDQESASTTIIDLPPVPGAVALEPGNVTPCAPLRCGITVEPTDPDGDELDVQIAWRRNGTPWTGSTLTTAFDDDTIPASALSPGDTWTCRLVVADASSVVSSPPATATVGDDTSAGVISYAPPAIDLLMVIDDGTSMAAHQGLVDGALPTLVDALDTAGIAWRIGVTTHSTSTDAGHLAVSGGHRWVDPSTANALDVLSDLVSRGTAGSGPRAGFDAAIAALSPPAASGHNAGFRRQDARLHVVFVSNADDASLASVAETSATLSSFVPDPRDVAVSAVTGPRPSGCTAIAAGLRYLQLVGQTGGGAVSLCTGDYADAMSDLVDHADRNRFIGVPGTTTGALEIERNGGPLEEGTDYTYTLDHTVLLSSPLAPGDSLQLVAPSCAAEPMPAWPEPRTLDDMNDGGGTGGVVPPHLRGDYVGTMTHRQSYPTGTDVCTGSLTLTVASGSWPTVFGSTTCTWTTLATYGPVWFEGIGSPIQVQFEGSVTENGTLTGTIYLSDGAAFSRSHTVIGNISAGGGPGLNLTMSYDSRSLGTGGHGDASLTK